MKSPRAGCYGSSGHRRDTARCWRLDTSGVLPRCLEQSRLGDLVHPSLQPRTHCEYEVETSSSLARTVAPRALRDPTSDEELTQPCVIFQCEASFARNGWRRDGRRVALCEPALERICKCRVVATVRASHRCLQSWSPSYSQAFAVGVKGTRSLHHLA